ncbi:hypothetical protein HNQ93_000716 [Hymenobacter luteus]|uniref:Uncharacterized protein n=2 Tax=Hymenobacter TaxID=89966 RepID=A0A7W9SXS6_9BACT|nr:MULTISPECIES: hypothetical protein [Hymenobacter]MBB4599804.1 hypothetical protein [Hymenobacter latericoloratus]MBB6057886.1 hypothetical protein [Hymenobacter luteus]
MADSSLASTSASGWAAPGGLSPIPKEELFRVLDEENMQLADLPRKNKHLADKIRDIHEKSSGEKLQPADMEAFEALVGREATEWIARRPHV